MANISQKLQDTGFRFTEIVEGTKEPPGGFRWKKEDNYKWNELGFVLNYLRTAKSYGVVCGYNNLVVIDSDSEELHQMLKNLSTYTVKTGREGGYHYYLKVPDIAKVIKEQSIKLKTPESKKKFGDLIVTGYVIGAGSLHYDENGEVDGKYEVVNDTDIATISLEKLNEVLIPFDILGDTPKREKFVESEHLDILKILEMNDVSIEKDFKRTGTKYAGVLPALHKNKQPSKHNRYFTFDTKIQMWRCWFDDSWGDNLSLIAMFESIITCEELEKKGALKGEKYRQAVKIAIQKYELKKKWVITERIQILGVIKKLKETERIKEKNRVLYKEICKELGWEYNISNAKRLGHIVHKELKLDTKYVHGGNAVIFDDKTIKRLLYLFSRYRTYNII